MLVLTTKKGKKGIFSVGATIGGWSFLVGIKACGEKAQAV